MAQKNHLSAMQTYRLDRAIQFKRLIVQTRKSLKQGFRTKRFVEISPSVKSRTGCTVHASERQFISGSKTKKFGIY